MGTASGTSSLWEQKEDQRLWLVSTGTGYFGQKANKRPMLTQEHAALLASAAGASEGWCARSIGATGPAGPSRAPASPWEGKAEEAGEGHQ